MSAPTQHEIVALRESDPIAWLLDKAERGVAFDMRGNPRNRVAVIRICRLARAALDAKIAVCSCEFGASGCHDDECPCAGGCVAGDGTVNAATDEKIERIFQNAAWAARSLGPDGMDGISAANLAHDLATVKGAWDELVAENARYRDALDRIRTLRERMHLIAGYMYDESACKIAREALAGSGGDTTNG